MVRVRGAISAAIAALGLVSGLAACSGPEFPDKTAEVVVGGDRRTYEVASCGLDRHTIFLVARADDGAVVQAVVGLEDDDKTGVLPATGLTIDLDPQRTDTRLAAFGREAWARRGAPGAAPGSPPGEITSARLRGSRIQVSGRAVPVDAEDAPIERAKPVDVSIDARCDEDS